MERTPQPQPPSHTSGSGSSSTRSSQLSEGEWLQPDDVPMLGATSPWQPTVYDPYGGLPRREDLDVYNTSQPLPPPAHEHDLRATYRSFRGVVLSTQSWGVQWPEATDTSVKRWIQRALKADDGDDAFTPSPQAPHQPPAASSGGEGRTKPRRRRPVRAPVKQPAQPPPTQQKRQHQSRAATAQPPGVDDHAPATAPAPAPAPPGSGEAEQ
ncbi:hypothetical protein NESM_000865200 [Novymonas esmeraldas]|uniref:Uncharacterized protein n=1 Tax=Novymonas esmeraldas TaxID=1808958 RepID=A0AAW0F1P0_9TRYP